MCLCCCYPDSNPFTDCLVFSTGKGKTHKHTETDKKRHNYPFLNSCALVCNRINVLSRCGIFRKNGYCFSVIGIKSDMACRLAVTVRCSSLVVTDVAVLNTNVPGSV